MVANSSCTDRSSWNNLSWTITLLDMFLKYVLLELQLFYMSLRFSVKCTARRMLFWVVCGRPEKNIFGPHETSWRVMLASLAVYAIFMFEFTKRPQIGLLQWSMLPSTILRNSFCSTPPARMYIRLVAFTWRLSNATMCNMSMNTGCGFILVQGCFSTRYRWLYPYPEQKLNQKSFDIDTCAEEGCLVLFCEHMSGCCHKRLAQ